ncbi:nuclear transport factor 2 family protein [Rhizobium leguminosarum]|uniref:DUF4440 domain-containing protein n=1 Tax=Rhizobium leguminosarum TaxID=384 RepID=A0A7K3VTB6_RHILE|nr:nuclear transport factor 2 family protein [Rhizobium leguminosarum]NEK20356.1 DUF4440 domain-containing protein [Rhizobium leguminosarum]NKK38978.1 DUF4440 domain-containing protein [Rhizobium leguminosarum bv. viciae]
MVEANLVDFVTKAENVLLDAQVNQDRDALDGIISDDYVGIDPDGSRVTKKEEIENLLSSGYSSGKIISLEVNTYGGTAVATGQIVFNADEIVHRYSFTDVYVDEKLVSCQATLLQGG